jgi:hypothetical protein
MEAGQAIGLNGYISHDPEKKIVLEVDQLDLAILNAVTGLKFTGILDAKTELSNFYQIPSMENNIFVDSLTINNFLIGDITGKNLWINNEKRFDLNFFVDRLNNRIVNLTGFYNPGDKESPLDVNAKLEKANINIIEPFLDEFFSRWGGTITGNYHIHGKLNEPEINGEAEVVNGQMMINYLKTQYRFTGVVGITKNAINFRKFELIDNKKNKANVEGVISHANFQNPRINHDASFKNFLVLNTSAKDNSLF